MKKLIVFLFILFNARLYAQLTKEVVGKASAGWYRETYNVLKSNPQIKHGYYEAYSNTGRLFTTGSYKNGEKDSLWQEYNSFGEIVVRGNYEDGKPVLLRSSRWERKYL